MGGERRPGPTGTLYRQPQRLDAGTNPLQRTTPPGSVGALPDIASMPIQDRFVLVLQRTLPKLPHDMQEQFASLLSGQNLVIMAGCLAIWAGSHAFGVGEAGDVVLLCVGAYFLGQQAGTALRDLVLAIKLTVEATNLSDIDDAATCLADFFAIVGITVVMALFFKGAKKAAPKARAAIARLYAGLERSGITPGHLKVFQQVAQRMNRIIAVRSTNPASTPWIERGFPGKPLAIKIKTSKVTGIVTAVEENGALSVKDMITARSKGYYVVDADLVARNAGGEALELRNPDWPLEPGQVIDPHQLKPLVGDYDLLGVIDPTAPGRNLVVAASEGKIRTDWTNPMTRRVAAELNAGMDQPRVMHGAQDGLSGEYGGIPDKGGAVVFYPDGNAKYLATPAEVREFYDSINRQTIVGKY